MHLHIALRIFVDAMKPHLFDTLGQGGIETRDCAAFDGGHVFIGMETKADHVTGGADQAAMIARANGVCRVFNNAQVVVLGERLNGRHVYRQASEMHRDHRTRARIDGGRNRSGSEIAGM